MRAMGRGLGEFKKAKDDFEAAIDDSAKPDPRVTRTSDGDKDQDRDQAAQTGKTDERA